MQNENSPLLQAKQREERRLSTKSMTPRPLGTSLKGVKVVERREAQMYGAGGKFCLD